MTIISEFQSTPANSSALETLVSRDITVVGLWSACGLLISAVFAMAAFNIDAGMFQAIVW